MLIKDAKFLTVGTQLSRRGKVFFEVVSVDKSGFDYTLLTNEGPSRGLQLRNDGGQFRSLREIEKGIADGTYTITAGGYEA
jgi:hypothetical protein